MARKGREKSKSGIYNVLLRGNELFKSDGDYKIFVDLLGNLEADVLAYCLTSKTISLVIKESEQGISKDIKPMVTSYARYFNRTYKTEGKLFYDRFKSDVVEDSVSICENIIFVHRIPKLFSCDGVTSEIEYEDKKNICNVDFAKDKMGSQYDDMKNNSQTKLCMYNYADLTDKQIKNAVENAAVKTILEIKKLKETQSRAVMELIKKIPTASLNPVISKQSKTKKTPAKGHKTEIKKTVKKTKKAPEKEQSIKIEKIQEVENAVLKEKGDIKTEPVKEKPKNKNLPSWLL